MSIDQNHRQTTGRGRIARAIKSGFAALALSSAVTALTIVGVGSASAATATPAALAATAVTGVTWHPLTAINGWQSGQAQYSTGSPAWTVRNGVVYLSGSVLQPSGGVVHLSGSVYQPSGTSQIFAVLPKADRPAHDLYIQVMVYTPDNIAYAGTVLVEPDGATWAYSQAPGNAQQYTSLAGISFPLGS